MILRYANSHMYYFERVIFLRETDATGVLHFSSLLELGTEAFQRYLLSTKVSLHQIFSEKGEFGFPIVHVQADFFAPLKAGDFVKICLSCVSIDLKKFTLQASVSKKEIEAGRVQMIHVCVGTSSNKAIPIPSFLLTHLRNL